MTITAQDVYSTLGPQNGYPPIPPPFMDHVVRVLNAHCASAATVQGTLNLDPPSTSQDTAAPHPPLPRPAVHPDTLLRGLHHLTHQGNPA